MYRAECVFHGEVLSTDYGFYWLAREGGGVLWLRGDAAHEIVELYPKDGKIFALAPQNTPAPTHRHTQTSSVENLCFSSSKHSSNHAAHRHTETSSLVVVLIMHSPMRVRDIS